MASTSLNTRIKIRYDDYSNWMNSNQILLEGEMAVAVIPSDTPDANYPETANAGNSINYSNAAVLVKVGDGSHTFAELPYITARAGDIYDWAKAATKPTYNATEIKMGGSGDDANTSVAAKITDIAGQIASIIASGGDTNTLYQLEVGTGENAGKIRLNSKDGNDETDTFAQHPGSWITMGSTITVANNGIEIDTSTPGTTSIGAKVSAKSNNALSINTTSNEEGLYVPKTSVSAYTPGAGTGEVDVLTGIATSDGHTITQSVTQVYTKDKIDSLINPSMEFKGVKTAAEVAALTGVQIGDSYKISTGGTINNNTVKAGDLVIYVAKGTTPETYEWAIIPSGDESFTDTYREIQVNGTQLLDNALSGGEVNFVDGPGVGITGSGNDISFELDLTAGTGITITQPTAGNNDITIAADVNTIATTQMTSGNGTGKTLQGQIDTLNGADSVTGSVAKAVKDGIAGITTSQSAGVDGNSKQKVFTAITQTNGVVSTSATTLSITDIDVGDYLILNGGNASSFSS